VDLEPLDGSTFARIEADPAQRDVTPHPVPVGNPPVDRDRRLAERPLVLAQVVLELGVGAHCGAGRAMTYEWLGDQVVDDAEIAFPEGAVLPPGDDRDRVEGFGTVAAHTWQYRRAERPHAQRPFDSADRVAYAAHMATLVLTLVGNDRTGLVNAVARTVTAHGGNWERSQVAELAGKFAGIVVVTVSDDRSGELIAALEPLKGLLDVTVQLAVGQPVDQVTTIISLDLVGTDRPGIVSDITRVLNEHGVNIESLTTATREAPMAGGTLFEASAELEITDSVDLTALQRSLEQLANELMVDLTLEA
jgi:glycine cleavage system regulatory protein